jgi:hypothetical protein
LTRPSATWRDDFVAGVTIDVMSGWDFYQPTYGPLLGPWNGHPKSAEKRFCLLTETILNLTLRKRDPEWSCFVDVDDQNKPNCIVMERALDSLETPISWTPRSAKIGAKRIFFASKVAGDALIATLTEIAADMFATTPKSSPSHRPVYREELALDGRPPA